MLVAIVLAVALAAPALAGVKESTTPQLMEGYWTPQEPYSQSTFDDYTTCSFSFSNHDSDLTISTTMNVLSKEDGCSRIYNLQPSQDIVTFSRHNNYRKTNNPTPREEPKIPVVLSAGELSRERKSFGRSTHKANLIATTLRKLEAAPEETFTMHKAAVCAEEMTLKFSKTPATPDEPWSRLVVSTDHDHYMDCEDVLPQKSSLGNGFDLFEDRSTLDKDISKGFQGWVQTGEPAVVGLPLLCSDIKITFHEEEHGDWGMKGKTLTYSQNAGEPDEKNSLIREFGEDPKNVFEARFTYDPASGLLEDYSISIVDHTSSIGGVEYSIACVDPKDPYENQDTCKAVSGDSGAWDDNAGCCYKDNEEEYATDADGHGIVCTTTDAGGYEWTPSPKTACSQPDGYPEGRLIGDPDSYCCTAIEATPFNNSPHLYDREDEVWITGNAADAKEYYCTANGNLVQKTVEDKWAYDGERWVTCTEENNGTTAGSHLCRDEAWETCECSEENRGASANCGELEETGWYCGFTDEWSEDPNHAGACSAVEDVGGKCCREDTNELFIGLGSNGDENNEDTILKACVYGTVVGPATSRTTGLLTEVTFPILEGIQ